MKIKIQSHTVIDDKIIVSGYIEKKTNLFQDLEVMAKDLIDFIKRIDPAYIFMFTSDDFADDEYSHEILDQERMLDEIDYGLLSKYIHESNLLNA